MNKKTMREQVLLLKLLESKQKELESQITTVKKSIQDTMNNSGVYEYEGEDWKVSWNTVCSNRFDQTSFSNDHPKLYDKYKKLSESRRFVYTSSIIK